MFKFCFFLDILNSKLPGLFKNDAEIEQISCNNNNNTNNIFSSKFSVSEYLLISGCMLIM